MTPHFVIESARLAGQPLLCCQTDARLIDLVRAGNDRAFEAIVDRYRRPLLRFCARMLPSSRAEDAVQQTFLNAYSAMRGSDAALDLRPWLYRIARNACLNALRENGWSHERIDELARGVESAHEVVERRQELHAVVAAVSELPERQREAVVMRALEGRSYDQIAAAMDASDGAVRQLLNRARHTLRAGVTAITPLALLTRLPLSGGQSAAARLAEAAAHDGIRGGAGRVAGVGAAALAVMVGLVEAPRHLIAQHGLQKALDDPDALPMMSIAPPSSPGSGRSGNGTDNGTVLLARASSAPLPGGALGARIDAARRQPRSAPRIVKAPPAPVKPAADDDGGARAQATRRRGGGGSRSSRTSGTGYSIANRRPPALGPRHKPRTSKTNARVASRPPSPASSRGPSPTANRPRPSGPAQKPRKPSPAHRPPAGYNRPGGGGPRGSGSGGGGSGYNGNGGGHPHGGGHGNGGGGGNGNGNAGDGKGGGKSKGDGRK